jgi:hypothetical protein
VVGDQSVVRFTILGPMLAASTPPDSTIEMARDLACCPVTSGAANYGCWEMPKTMPAGVAPRQ